MSVVHVVVAGEIGGAERMLVDLARASRLSTSIALMTPEPRLRDLLLAEGIVVDDRGLVREGPLSYLKRSLGESDVAWLAEVLVRRRARIAHLHTFASQVLGTRAARRIGAKIVRTEHSTRVYDDPSCWPFSRWSLRRADAAVCISDHVRRVASARAPWSGFDVVPNGVDLGHFAPSPPPLQGPVRLAIVGRLEPRKGVDVALDALVHVPDVVLDVVGDGPDRASLEARAYELGLAGRVRFVGFVGDVRPFVAAADAVLSSARAEGLGIALLEAMALGRPVLALPVGGVPEIVRDGETGFLARGTTVPALASLLRERSKRDALANLGPRARAFVASAYSVSTMADGYARIYERVLESSPGGEPQRMPAQRA